MLERYNGQFELKDVLFTRSELYDRALSIFPDGKKLTYLEFRKYVVNFGANTDEDCLIQDEMLCTPCQGQFMLGFRFSDTV